MTKVELSVPGDQRTIIAIDLKSFYASVECADRKYDPLSTNLVVADATRTEKTICLAVSPSLKAHGISGRARLFEVVQRVREVNAERFKKARALGVLPRERTGNTISPPPPSTRRRWQRIRRWSWPISWRRPGWRCMKRSPPGCFPST